MWFEFISGNYRLWEEVALKDRLMEKISEEVGVFKIAVRSARQFQNLLANGISDYLQEKGIGIDRELYHEYLPTDETLTKKVRKKDGSNFGRNTFHGSRHYF